jgi:hypothetical protein
VELLENGSLRMPALTDPTTTARVLVRRTADAMLRARRMVIDAQVLCSKAQALRRFSRILKRHA